MLLFLLCGILFPHTHGNHGYHYQQPFHTYPSSLAPYGSIYPGDHGSHTFQTYPENHGTHTFEKSQPETNYGTYTYEKSQPYGNSHIQQYPWQTQWKKLGWIASDGRQTDGQGTYGEGQDGNGQVKPSPDKEQMFFPFVPTTKPDQDPKEESQAAAEIIFKPTRDEIIENDDSEPPAFPGKTSYNDDDADPPPFPTKTGDFDDSEPPPFHGGTSYANDDADPPPLPTKTGDFDDSEPLQFHGETSYDDDDADPLPFPKKNSDHDDSKYPAFPSETSYDNDDPPPFPKKQSDHDDSEPPAFPGEKSYDDDDDDPTKTSDFDDSEPFPGNINDDDDSDSESSGDSEEPTTPGDTDGMNSDKISPETNPVRIGVVSTPADEMDEDKTDNSYIGNFDSGLAEKKNMTTHRPPQMTMKPPSGPEPGTMSRPVPKLGLLFAPSLQWHVGIYSKSFTPYMQVCGGSLVKADVVLSAAHCFWNDDVGALRPGLFGVAAGKLLRPWETEGEIYTQHSDIKDIKIPPRFRGSKTSFQDDIAVVLLTRALEYAPGVKPVCISFDQDLEQGHLTSGNLGTIAGWGLTEPNGPPSQRLNYLKLPYVDIDECLRTAEDSFLKYITSDKICAGDQKTGRALCRGDSGGGLIYYSSTIPYLHGIASTAPRDGNQCNAYAVATFTHVLAHRRFLIAHVPGIEEGCEGLYGVGSVQNEPTVKPQENATESNIPQVQEEDRMANPTLQNISDVSGPVIPLAVQSIEGEVTDRKPMWQNDRSPYLLGQQNEQSTKTNEESIKTNEDTTKTIEESVKTNEEPIKTNEEPIKTNEESAKTNEESKDTNEEEKGKIEEVMMNVKSGEKAVARVQIDNNTKTFVCNCFCNK